MRSLSPSRTFTCTRTVSPDFIAGRSATCDFSTSSIAPIFGSFKLAQNLLLFFVQLGARQQIRPPLQRPAHRFALPPPPNVAVIPRHQHVGNLQHRRPRAAADGNFRRPRILRKIERSEEHTSELQSRQYLVCRLLL